MSKIDTNTNKIVIKGLTNTCVIKKVSIRKKKPNGLVYVQKMNARKKRHQQRINIMLQYEQFTKTLNKKCDDLVQKVNIINI